MTNAAELTQEQYISVRNEVARIIAGPEYQGIVPLVTAEHRQSAEYLIDAGAVDLTVIVPEVEQ